MERVDPQIAFAAKEEILRNIVKTHAVILIEGWTGTGKTVTTLKAVKGLGEVYYYTESAGAAPQSISLHNDTITVLENSQALRDLHPIGKQCLIFDDLDRMGSEARGILTGMIKERTGDRKILIITQVVLDAQDILQNMDAVVRFRQNTAEMLHSKLHNLDHI
jgi:hypothetical protein